MKSKKDEVDRLASGVSSRVESGIVATKNIGAWAGQRGGGTGVCAFATDGRAAGLAAGGQASTHAR